MTTVAKTSTTATVAAQLDLINLADFDGFGALKRRERLFAEAIFQGMTQRAAAKAAGVEGSSEVLDQAGHSLMRSPRVQRLLAQAWTKSGASIHRTLAQAAQLQQQAFCQLQNSDATSERREAFRQWREASTLIASIHGRLSLRIDGDINHYVDGSVNVIPPSALGILAQMRRDVMSESRTIELPKNSAE
jgi:hypothetical protein